MSKTTIAVDALSDTNAGYDCGHSTTGDGCLSDELHVSVGIDCSVHLESGRGATSSTEELMLGLCPISSANPHLRLAIEIDFDVVDERFSVPSVEERSLLHTNHSADQQVGGPFG